MRTAIVDIETIPLPMAELEKKMPESVRDPQIPPELLNPVEPDYAAECPNYGLKEALAKLETFPASAPGEPAMAENPKRTAAVAKLREAEDKRAKWIEEKRAKFRNNNEAAKEKFREDSLNARAQFVDKAALDARLSNCKLIVLREIDPEFPGVVAEVNRMFLWEPSPEVAGSVRKWFKALPDGFQLGEDMVRRFSDKPVTLHICRTEQEMFSRFFAEFLRIMDPDAKTAVDPFAEVEARCLTYYGNVFDFPYMYRRAWILGLKVKPLFMRGRYFDERRMIDLHERWTMGVKDERSGGLEALALTLGMSDYKETGGESFWKWYARDPVDGLAYCLGDIEKTAHCARMMGEL